MHEQWGIMSDWRLSYFTLMPTYQSMVIKKFAKFASKGMIFRGDRPVFWSIDNQRVMGDDEMRKEHEVIDSVVLKLPIAKFGRKSKNIKKLYPEANLLVFCQEPW